MGSCSAHCGSESCGTSSHGVVPESSIAEIRKDLEDTLHPVAQQATRHESEQNLKASFKDEPEVKGETSPEEETELAEVKGGASPEEKIELADVEGGASPEEKTELADDRTTPQKRASLSSCESGFTAAVRNSEYDLPSDAESTDSDHSCNSDSDSSSLFNAFRPNKRHKEMRLMITHTMGLNPSRALGLIIENADSIHNHYRLDEAVLGQGAFGVVKKAELVATKAKRAAKIISKDRMKESKHAFKKEIEIMKMVDHPNLLMLYEIFEDEANMYLVMQLCAGGHLLSYLKKAGKFTEGQSAKTMKQILRGVCYLHRRNICHRDLKAENCLLTLVAPVDKNHLKIADFGLSRILEKGGSFKQLAGTVTHMAPEVLARKYNLACDLWACGVILFELLSGKLPFRGHNFEEIERQILKTIVSFESPEWITQTQKAMDYTGRFLSRSVRRRITAKEALGDAWLMEHSTTPPSIQLHGKALLNVVKFRSLSRLKRAILHVMACMVDDSDIDKAREFFLMVDVDCDGMVSFKEIKAYLDMKTYTKAEKDATDGLEMEDLSYTEFVAATLDRGKHLKSNVFKAVFSSFDKNGDGSISISELSTGKLLGHLSPSELMDEMEQVDLDGDMTMDFKEFKRMMLTSKSQLGVGNCIEDVGDEL